MITLRVVLVVPESDSHPAARAAFDEVSDVHSDQAIFQVNQTRHVDGEHWGFRVTYRSNAEFVRTTSLRAIERVMSRVAPNTFERRIETGDTE